jgi:hypothetical protein
MLLQINIIFWIKKYYYGKNLSYSPIRITNFIKENEMLLVIIIFLKYGLFWSLLNRQIFPVLNALFSVLIEIKRFTCR